MQDNVDVNTDDLLISDHIFEKMINDSTDEISENNSYNYCSDCSVDMELTMFGFECPECGMRRQVTGNYKDCCDDSIGTIRVSNGRNLYYNLTPNYSKTQRKQILDQLYENNRLYKGEKFPNDLLIKVANEYNEIQKIIFDENNKKKFVKRGDIKDEILGALIKYECMKEHIPRKNKAICEFMRLSSSGISRGESILRNLYLDGKVDILVNLEPNNDYVDVYMKRLKITNLNYINFVKDLVDECIRRKIGINSMLTSKIAGCIWILIVHESLNITMSQLETAADGIRKNTWIKFSNLVEKNILKFIDIFLKYNIRHGIVGTLVKRSELKELLKNSEYYSYRTSIG